MTLKQLIVLLEMYEKDKALDSELELFAVDESTQAYFPVDNIHHDLKTNRIELRR